METLGEDRRAANPRLRYAIPDAARVIYGTRELYSYGRHFPLARFVPSKRGRRAMWLINGDSWRGGGWSLTNRHQAETRTAIETAIADAAKRGKRIDSLIVPFTALDGAGIDRDSIRPIHVRPDRREPFTNTSTIPARFTTSPLPSREDCETSSRASDPKGSAIMRTDTLASSLTINIRTESLETGAVSTSTVTGDLTRSVVYNGYDYSLPVTIKCHLCEDGQISADPHGYGHVPAGTTFECARCNGTGLVIRHGAYVEYDPPQVTMWHAGSRKLTIQNGQGEDTNVTWPTDRHWLGDSLFSATRVSRRRVPCPNHEPGRMADGTLSNVCEHCHGAMSNNTRQRRSSDTAPHAVFVIV